MDASESTACRKQIPFQTNDLALLQKYIYRQIQCSKTWDSECLALIARMLRAFGMNPTVGSSSPSQVEPFSLSKTLSLSRIHSKYKLYFNNILTTRASVETYGTANVWPWSLKWLEHSAWIRRLWVGVPLRSRHFLSQKCWHVHKNNRSCVENECCCPRTDYI